MKIKIFEGTKGLLKKFIDKVTDLVAKVTPNTESKDDQELIAEIEKIAEEYFISAYDKIPVWSGMAKGTFLNFENKLPISEADILSQVVAWRRVRKGYKNRGGPEIRTPYVRIKQGREAAKVNWEVKRTDRGLEFHAELKLDNDERIQHFKDLDTGGYSPPWFPWMTGNAKRAPWHAFSQKTLDPEDTLKRLEIAYLRRFKSWQKKT